MRISDWSSDVCSSDLAFLAAGIAGTERHAAIGLRLRRPGRETAIALARDLCGLRVDAVEVIQHRTDRGGKIVEIQSVEAGPCGHQLFQVPLAQPFDEAFHLDVAPHPGGKAPRSEEHTSELQSLMRISYAVFCLNKNTEQTQS